MGGQYRRIEAHSVRQQAGVGDQDPTCRNGNADCPGPNSGTSALPCTACFVEGMQDG